MDKNHKIDACPLSVMSTFNGHVNHEFATTVAELEKNGDLPSNSNKNAS